MNKVAQIIISGLWMLLSITLAVNTWSWFTTIGEFITDDAYKVIYWIGYTTMLISCGFIIPFVIAKNAMEEE